VSQLLVDVDANPFSRYFYYFIVEESNITPSMNTWNNPIISQYGNQI
jgi:hypothetical protein